MCIRDSVTPDDLVATTVADAAAATVATPLSTREDAEAFVYDQAGWRVLLPTIRGYRLDGAGMRDVTPVLAVPVVRYVPDGSDAAVTAPVFVYAYTYRLLDEARESQALAPGLLAGLEDEAHIEQIDSPDATALAWRSRDDILLAVARPPLTDLAVRIER